MQRKHCGLRRMQASETFNKVSIADFVTCRMCSEMSKWQNARRFFIVVKAEGSKKRIT